MSTVKVIAHNFILKENLEKVLPLYEEMVAETRKENGCIQYDLLRDNADETHFVFVETWESQAHLEAHFKTPHFTRIIPAAGELADKSRSKNVELYTQVL